MGRVAFVNGRYVPHRHAMVHVEDRGYQFADGCYEVIAVRHGRLIDEGLHLERLERSLAAVRIPWPIGRSALRIVLAEMVARNQITAFGLVYLQVTRGVAPRNHPFPPSGHSALVLTARALPVPTPAAASQGVAVITIPDLRWRRCDIKSIALLPNVLGKQTAIERGAYEAWMVDSDGLVTEGTVSNAWIVTRDGVLVTRPDDAAILGGITRAVVLGLAEGLQMRCECRGFSVDEARGAAEAFLTSTTSLVKPVIAIDGTTVGTGGIGPLTSRLLQAYLEHIDGAGKQL
jgi:D-alanine transaminase